MIAQLRYFVPSFCALAALMGCAAATSDEGPFTKEEARLAGGISERGTDICELEAWYGDEECDEFCAQLDPDCAECAAVPTCQTGEVAHRDVSECPADASCREVTECGATIWCSDTATCAAVPTCNAGEMEHASESDCPADASCRAVTECGATIWCSDTATPECAGDNPQGCVSTGCDVGFHCDTTMGMAPSACVCEAETGTWACTPDLSGGICVAD